MGTATGFPDRYGLMLSTNSAAAAERYVEGVERRQALKAGSEDCLREAIAADEGFALPHAALALTAQFLGKMDEARASASRARELAIGATRRERQHVEIIATAVDGSAARAMALIDEHLDEFPRDALLLSQMVLLNTASGRKDRQQRSYERLARLAPYYGDDWVFLGVYSFLHHELNMFEPSRLLAERSLALYPRGGQATHSLAHVFYETDDHASGRDFLGGWMTAYDRAAPLHCHLSWHRALFDLASGNYGRVMELYERDILPALGSARTSLHDAASLLWRWRVYGCAEGSLPWGAVAEAASGSANRPGIAFNDVHAAMALAAAGDEATFGRLVDGLRDLDAKGHPLAGHVTLPIVLASAAFTRGEYTETIRLLEPLVENVELVRVGGSNAQREVFEDTLIAAYLRTGWYDRAEALLRVRLGRRTSARDLFWLGRAQAGRGEREAARVSFDDASARWSSADRNAPEIDALERERRGVAA
jgi:tetratricopeptide (TPR) repeat protein